MEYLSPSRINLFYQDRKAFYMRYMSSKRPPGDPQTKPMAAGSAFDAFVKSYLHEGIFGKGNDPRYEINNLFEAQVEKHLWDWARPVGKYLFETYKKCGALSDLMLELSQSINKPRFEIEIKGAVEGTGMTREPAVAERGRIVFLGKPDAFYINKEGCHVILDWKVTGFCGKYKTSPLKGYLKLRTPTGSIGAMHKDCYPKKHKGTVINCTMCLEDVKPDWATQLSIYSWLLGGEIGEDFIAAIDQVACDGTDLVRYDSKYDYPGIRVAEHRLRIHSDFQQELFKKCQHVWEVVHSDWYFRDMTREESQSACQLLDRLAEDMWPKTEEDAWFNRNTR